MPRFFVSIPLSTGLRFELPAQAARHIQVLRMQPQMPVTLFDGMGGEYEAVIENIGRKSVRAQVGTHRAIEREATQAVHLALGVPANERMDWLIEKAVELGVHSITPLMTERGVLRLHGERADKKNGHWQSIAQAACEQSGRNRVPVIQAVNSLANWLHEIAINNQPRYVLSLTQGAIPVGEVLRSRLLQPVEAKQPSDACETKGVITLLSGAEGGLTPSEEALALAAHFQPLSLGSRVLRAETAAITALGAFTLANL